MRRVALILCLLLPCLSGMAQQKHFEVAVNGSYMMTNNSSYWGNNAFGFGVDAAWWYRTTGDAWWMLRRQHPSFGIKVSYEHIPDGIAGDRFGIVGLLRGCFLPGVDWLEWNIGPGFSLYTKSAKITGDKTNVFISSALNCLIDFGLTAHLNERMTLGARLLHTSNGMLSRPNQGLNYIQLDVGVKFGDTEKLPLVECPDTSFRRHELGFTLSPGVAMTRYEPLDGYYPCYDLSLNYLYYVDPVVAFGVTADLWYSFVDNELKKRYNVEWPVPCYLSVMPTAEGFWGPVSIKAGMGANLLTSDLIGIKIYERVGVYYNWNRHYAGVAIHAHAGQIMFIEWSWGMRFAMC